MNMRININRCPNRFARLAVVPVLVVGACLFVRSADASERRFAYTYQSDVLNAGTVEIEPWSTFRLGRDGFFIRQDHRLEFEIGVAEGLQTAWYLKWHAIAAGEGAARTSGFTWDGISWEWKLKVSDAVADALGLALYFEPGLAPEEAELEAKVIVDRRFGDWLVAANAVAEVEWKFDPDEVETELKLELDLGLAYFITPQFSVGIEARNQNPIVLSEGLEDSPLFLGPVASYSSDAWWATLTLLPQVASFAGQTHGPLALAHHERVEVRLLFGFHL